MHTAHKGLHQECPPQVTGEAEPLGPIGHLPHKATLSTQGNSQNAETKKHVMNERNGGKKTTGYRVQNHSLRLLKNLLETSEELSETFKDFNENAKKMENDQSEIKHTLTEIKNNIQRFKCRLENHKNQVKDLKYVKA